jgi:hypothetical protein
MLLDAGAGSMLPAVCAYTLVAAMHRPNAAVATKSFGENFMMMLRLMGGRAIARPVAAAQQAEPAPANVQEK